MNSTALYLNIANCHPLWQWNWEPSISTSSYSSQSKDISERRIFQVPQIIQSIIYTKRIGDDACSQFFF